MEKLVQSYLQVCYTVKDDQVWKNATSQFLKKYNLKPADLVLRVKDFIEKFPPQSAEEAQRFLKRIPSPKWWEEPYYSILVKPIADAKLKVPDKKPQWWQGISASLCQLEEEIVTAGILDFPRKKLPEEIWLYEEQEPLPRLQPKLRSTILKEARYRLSKFGAKLVGCMLYGGAATYQYHKGADIDCSLYIDWKSFNGNEEILQEAFKNVEIPWEGYVIHLFVKPSNQQEQVEVADASYDVLNDEWALPPLILPKDFDPNIYFAPLMEVAEKKAEKIDLLMGRVAREWSKLKYALDARKEGPRDDSAVEKRIELQKVTLSELIDRLVKEFVSVWTGRRKLHDQLRKEFVANKNIDRFVRFQPPEVTWKYLDQAGYAEYLKFLSKAHESGTIQKLLDEL